MFETGVMITKHDLEIIRRSAAMAPLSRDETFRLVEACNELLAERARIEAVLAELPASWSSVRAAMNELSKLLRATDVIR